MKIRPRLASAALLALTCLAFGSLARASDERLRFDGLYVAPKVKDGVQYFKYLKFYRDGLVIGVSTVGRPKEIQAWFTPGNDNVPKGSYRATGVRISFSLISKAGTVDYVGEVTGNDIKLLKHSEINQNEGQEIYSFVELKAEQTVAADRGENAAPAERQR